MEVYTVEEVAQTLKVPVETVYKWLRNGSLKGAKLGKHWRITEEQLQAFIDERSTK